MIELARRGWRGLAIRVERLCECGYLAVGLDVIPPTVDYARQVLVKFNCDACGALLLKNTTWGELLAADGRERKWGAV